MEHNLVHNISDIYGIQIPDEKAKLLFLYANEILKSNRRFNLTGLKNIEEIIDVLLMKSLAPVYKKDVPRGTSFLDIGTGAGIPGIPLSIVFDEINGILVDSNQKKISFIDEVVNKLSLGNIKTNCMRIEDLAKEIDYRESFQLVFARGVGEPYVAMELGAAFLETGGFLVIYSNEHCESIGSQLSAVSMDLGLALLSKEEREINQFSGNLVVFRKIQLTSDKYPRRYSAIKRESKQFMK